MRVCLCVSAFFVYVISRSSSVRFRHKAQTPETRENIQVFSPSSLLLVWCHCALQHYEREKHTHSPGISNIIYILYIPKSNDFIESRLNILKTVSVAQILLLLLKPSFFLHISCSLARALHYFFCLPHFGHIYWRIFHFELISVLIVFNEL